MKLIFAIVQDEDANLVTDELNKAGYRVTRLCSSGGFLKLGNTTLLIGVESERLQEAVEIVKKNAHSRKQYIQPPLPAGMIGPVPVEIMVGGATIFVLDADQPASYTPS